MQPLIQSAMDAARSGDKDKAVEILKNVLGSQPNDLDALLALASVVDESTRKRQVLNRVLSLEPTHQVAREMLLEMDRAEMSAYRSQPISAPVSKAQSLPDLAAAQQNSVPRKASNPTDGKPLVFRYSTAWLAVLYLFTAFFCCTGLLVASQNIANSLPSLGLALLFGLSALSVSSKVEVSEAGVRTSSLLGRAEVNWSDIASIKSNSMKRKLELISRAGESVKVSTQVKGYAVIIELLRQRRPDLFGEVISTPIQPSMSTSRFDQSSSTSYSQSVSAPSISGAKTFQKSFIKQYGILFVLIPAGLFFVWLSFASADTRTAFLVTAAFCVLLTLIPFFQVSAIKVEPNKLTIETFFEQKELTAGQIKEIKMQSIRGRYGRVTNLVNIISLEGKNHPLGGFPDGEEIIYGYLVNWWNTYQNK